MSTTTKLPATATLAAKERPILFSDAMVRAIIDGSKTQTRRVVKGRALEWLDSFAPSFVAHPENYLSPYGYAGDRLWVREAWQAVQYGPPNFDGRDVGIYVADVPVQGMPVLYRASDDDGLSQQGFRWRPSIHMPRWASRMTLEVTTVRVERLQEIGEADAIAEGVTDRLLAVDEVESEMSCTDPGYFTPRADFNHRGGFSHLWDSINADRGYGWCANPWVWVVEFHRIPTEG